MAFHTSWTFSKTIEEVRQGVVSAFKNTLKLSDRPWKILRKESDEIHAIRTRSTSDLMKFKELNAEQADNPRAGKNLHIYDIKIKLEVLGPNETRLAFESMGRFPGSQSKQNKRNSTELYDAIPFTPKKWSSKARVFVPNKIKAIVKAMVNEEDGIPVQRRTRFAFAKCFSGEEAVTWTLKYLQKDSNSSSADRNEALNVLSYIMEHQIFGTMKNPKLQAMKDDPNVFYAFQVGMEFQESPQNSETEWIRTANRCTSSPITPPRRKLNSLTNSTQGSGK